MALVAQAADALHAAHERGVVHRDVKPGNLLVRPNGTLVLTDFGIARAAGAAQLTAAGSVLGTASYISPEQAMGEQATALSDVYALGVVAYQCLAGRRPFEGGNPLEIAMRHVREAPPPLPPDIPPQVRAIVERAIAKDPAARWPTAAAFAAVSRRAAGELAAMSGRPGLAPVTHGSRPVPPPVIPTSPGVVGGMRPVSGGSGPVTVPSNSRPLPPTPPGVRLPPGYHPPGAPPTNQTSTGLIVAIIVAVVLVAVCVGAAIAIWQQAEEGKKRSAYGVGAPPAPPVLAVRFHQ
jgi:serine/threonine-protein kinase